jgi:hypothetical protein
MRGVRAHHRAAIGSACEPHYPLSRASTMCSEGNLDQSSSADSTTAADSYAVRGAEVRLTFTGGRATRTARARFPCGGASGQPQDVAW